MEIQNLKLPYNDLLSPFNQFFHLHQKDFSLKKIEEQIEIIFDYLNFLGGITSDNISEINATLSKSSNFSRTGINKDKTFFLNVLSLILILAKNNSDINFLKNKLEELLKNEIFYNEILKDDKMLTIICKIYDFLPNCNMKKDFYFKKLIKFENNGSENEGIIHKDLYILTNLFNSTNLGGFKILTATCEEEARKFKLEPEILNFIIIGDNGSHNFLLLKISDKEFLFDSLTVDSNKEFNILKTTIQGDTRRCGVFSLETMNILIKKYNEFLVSNNNNANIAKEKLIQLIENSAKIKESFSYESFEDTKINNILQKLVDKTNNKFSFYKVYDNVDDFCKKEKLLEIMNSFDSMIPEILATTQLETDLYCFYCLNQRRIESLEKCVTKTESEITKLKEYKEKQSIIESALNNAIKASDEQKSTCQDFYRLNEIPEFVNEKKLINTKDNVFYGLCNCVKKQDQKEVENFLIYKRSKILSTGYLSDDTELEKNKKDSKSFLDRLAKRQKVMEEIKTR